MLRGMTLRDVQAKSGLAPSVVCKIEHGGGNPTLRTAARLAEALGSSLSEMLHDKFLDQSVRTMSGSVAVDMEEVRAVLLSRKQRKHERLERNL